MSGAVPASMAARSVADRRVQEDVDVVEAVEVFDTGLGDGGVEWKKAARARSHSDEVRCFKPPLSVQGAARYGFSGLVLAVRVCVRRGVLDPVLKRGSSAVVVAMGCCISISFASVHVCLFFSFSLSLFFFFCCCSCTHPQFCGGKITNHTAIVHSTAALITAAARTRQTFRPGGRYAML